MRCLLPTEVLIAPGVFMYAGLHIEDDFGLPMLGLGVVLMIIGIVKANTGGQDV